MLSFDSASNVIVSLIEGPMPLTRDLTFKEDALAI